MTPVLGCVPVCLMLTSLGLVGLVLVLMGAVKDDAPADPNAPPPEPSTFPGWRVTLLIFAAVAFVMWALTEIAAPS
jgi:hypothetical protein